MGNGGEAGGAKQLPDADASEHAPSGAVWAPQDVSSAVGDSAGGSWDVVVGKGEILVVEDLAGE